MWKKISPLKAIELLIARKFDDVAYLSGDVVNLANCDALYNTLNVLLNCNWVQRVEPIRKVFKWGVVPGEPYELHLDVSEFSGLNIQIIVEETE